MQVITRTVSGCVASALAVLVMSGQADGQGPLIIPDSQNRSVSAQANADDLYEFDSDSDSASAPDFAPFVSALSADAEIGVATVSVGGSQDSQILDDGFIIEGASFGSAEAFGDLAQADGSASSTCSVGFVLQTEVNYTAFGYLNAFDNGFGSITLIGSGSPELSFFASGPSEKITINQGGVLAPGPYSLNLNSSSGVFADFFAFDYAFCEYALTLALTATEDEIGARFCDPAVPNSTGSAGVMHVRGSATVSDDNLVLEARNLPTGPNIGYFIMGTGTNTFTPPGSAGPICVAPGIKRYLPPVQNTQDLPGGFTSDVGTSGPVSGAITPGSTWSFQAWHRDSMAGTSNLTDAVSVSFL